MRCNTPRFAMGCRRKWEVMHMLQMLLSADHHPFTFCYAQSLMGRSFNQLHCGPHNLCGTTPLPTQHVPTNTVCGITCCCTAPKTHHSLSCLIIPCCFSLARDWPHVRNIQLPSKSCTMHRCTTHNSCTRHPTPACTLIQPAGACTALATPMSAVHL